MTGLTNIINAIAELQSIVNSDESLSDEDIAAGHLYVAGLYKWGTDRVVLGSDTLRPRFVRFMDTFSKWGLGNPDNLYLVAEVQSDAEYRITGHRGNCVDLLIEVRTGIGRRDDGVHSATLSFIDARRLQLASDGSFEVRLGGKGVGPNHLPLPPNATTILVRLTFGDWEKESISPMSIERIGPPAPSLPRPTSAEVSQQLDRVADVILRLGKFNLKVGEEWRASVSINSFPAPTTKVGDGFFPGQHSAIGQFKFDHEGQALIVTLEPLQARYLGFSIGDTKWYSTFDYQNRQCSLNNFQAYLSQDSRYRFVISAHDPGVPNWIDTGGHLNGFMFFRCQGLVGMTFGRPAVELVQTDEVPRYFPAGERRVGTEERLRTLQRRQIALNRRFAY